MKKFVIKYDKWYYYSDEVEGDRLVKNIEEARIFSEKQIKDYFGGKGNINNIFEIGDLMYCDEMEDDIEIKHKVELIEI